MSKLAQAAGGGGVVINKELDSFMSEFTCKKRHGIEYVKLYCSAHNLQSNILEDLISDYEYYEKNKKHKSINKWLGNKDH